jgi:seryl-tRNA synthetase
MEEDMLDIQYIRDNSEQVRQAAMHKNLNPAVVDEVLRLDQERRKLMTDAQTIRSERNKLNDQLKTARTPELITQSQTLKAKLADIEPQLKQLDQNFATLMLQIPNVTLDEVPAGKDSSGNQEVRKMGTKPTYNFEPKNHIDLGLDLDIIDIDRGSKVAGYRGYFLKNEAVMLQFALMRYALDKLTQKGFCPIIPPVIDRKEAFINTGHFPWGEMESYALIPEEPENVNRIAELGSAYQDAELNNRSDMYLAGTAEVPLVSYHANETLNEKDLPLKYAGFSPCFRREVGNYGKDTRGIYRVHEFMKIEQVILCANDIDESRKMHEHLLQNAEELLQDLGLHYRVMLMCTGDMGEPQMKKYDIETWMPGRNEYGETMSNSIMGEFQSRRANIRYRAKDGTIKYVHMLNNTAFASARMLIAILENYQQADGSVEIPKVLVPYTGFTKIARQA